MTISSRQSGQPLGDLALTYRVQPACENFAVVQEQSLDIGVQSGILRQELHGLLSRPDHDVQRLAGGRSEDVALGMLQGSRWGPPGFAGPAIRPGDVLHQIVRDHFEAFRKVPPERHDRGSKFQRGLVGWARELVAAYGDAGSDCPTTPASQVFVGRHYP